MLVLFLLSAVNSVVNGGSNGSANSGGGRYSVSRGGNSGGGGFQNDNSRGGRGSYGGFLGNEFRNTHGGGDFSGRGRGPPRGQTSEAYRPRIGQNGSGRMSHPNKMNRATTA